MFVCKLIFVDTQPAAFSQFVQLKDYVLFLEIFFALLHIQMNL